MSDIVPARTYIQSCVHCVGPIDFSCHAVTMDEKPSYVPFPEDERCGLVPMAHPKCFVEAEGLDRFLEMLVRHDKRQRQALAELRYRSMRRRAQR